MSATLYLDQRFTKGIANYPLSTYATADADAQEWVARREKAWRLSRSLGFIPLLSSDVTNPNILLFNPQLASADNKNQLVEITFKIANAGDQVGVMARANIATTNGFMALYNGAATVFQLAAFYNSGGLQFDNKLTTAWTPTVGTLYRIFLYVRSTNASTSTLRAWATTDAAPETTLVSLSTTDNRAELQTSGMFGPLILTANSGDSVQRIRAWLVDGTYSALADSTSGPDGPALEVLTVDGTGPYTYNWKRATTPAGTYTSVSGGTTARFTPSDRTADVTEYYQVVVTDTGAANATATSRNLAGIKLSGNITIGVARDSWGARYPNADDAGDYQLNTMPEYMRQNLAAMINRNVTIVNGSVTGITATTFISTYMEDWLDDVDEAGGTKYAEIAFGANHGGAEVNETDSDTVAEACVDDLRTICEACIARGIIPVVSSAQYFSPDPLTRSGRNSQRLRTMELINEKIEDDLIDGITILRGDMGMFDWVAANADLEDDHLHLNEWANKYLGARIAHRLANIIQPTDVTDDAGTASQTTLLEVKRIVQANAMKRT